MGRALSTLNPPIVIKALRERLERELRKEQSIESLIEDVMEIGRHCAALPLLDPRRPDEILGYDTNGGRPTAVDIVSWSARWLGTCKCVIWTTI
jgi:antitoxin VapB